MSQQRNLPQSKEVLLKSYNQRLKDDCKCMMENFFGESFCFVFVHLVHSLLHSQIFTILEIIKLAKGETDSQLSKITQCEQDTYEMQVRAANIGKF